MEREQEVNLIERALAGDDRAAGQLLQSHAPGLTLYLLRMCKHREIAEDVAQEAMYRAIKNLDRFDKRWRFSTWLFTIARRLWLNLHDRRSARSDSELIDALPNLKPVWELRGWSAEERDAAETSREVLDRALEKLPDVQREAVVLCHQLDWPVKLAGHVMGLPEGTVKSHLFRARAVLRAELAAWYDAQRIGEGTVELMRGEKSIGTRGVHRHRREDVS